MITLICPRDVHWAPKPQEVQYQVIQAECGGDEKFRICYCYNGNVANWHASHSHTPNTNKTLVEQVGFDFWSQFSVLSCFSV